MRHRLRTAAGLLAIVFCLPAHPAAQLSTPAGRGLGANYALWSLGPTSCGFANGYGIVATYNERGVRSAVQSQLAAMHSNGLTSLRFILWYQAFPLRAEDQWGPVVLTTGAKAQLQKQHETNIKWFLRDVASAGFQHVEVSMAPRGRLGPQYSDYTPASVATDWRVVQQVQNALMASGVPSHTLDLLNEGSPSVYVRQGPKGTWPAYDANTAQYLSAMYQRFADTYGTADVVVSSVMEDPDALVDLVAILRSTGRPMPATFEVHGYFWWYPNLGQGLYDGLARADATLTGAGLSQPLALRETYYDNADIATGLQSWTQDFARPLVEVTTWPLTAGSPCEPWNVAPPYQAGAYAPLFQ